MTSYSMRVKTHLTTTRLMAAVLAAVLMIVTLPAIADADSHPDFSEPHAHALLLHAETIPNPGVPGPPLFPIGYERCVDLAAGEALPRNSHHGTLHTGRAGQALAQAGHLVVPFTCGEEVDGYVAMVRAALGLD